jgi:hypothetical protein
MPIGSSLIEKPLQVQLIDQFFSGAPDDIRRALTLARSLLESDSYDLDNTTERLANSGPEPLRLLTEADAQHFREHWLQPDGFPWAGRGVGATMRAAYLDAVNAASNREPPIPIETFWVFSPLPDFEMRVSETDQQVTVFALIPQGDLELAPPPTGSRIRRFGPDQYGPSSGS